MKQFLVFMLFLLAGKMLTAQELKQEELQKILVEIVAPLKAGEFEQFIEHISFPFDVSSADSTESYTVETIGDAIEKYFTPEIIVCLLDEGSYQVALPDNHTWYMSVCFLSSGDHEVFVFTFKIVNDKWILVGLDLE